MISCFINFLRNRSFPCLIDGHIGLPSLSAEHMDLDPVVFDAIGQ
jgi:hypothetical protein